MAYSGRCLLSNFLTGRDANRGVCAQSCRWCYKVYEKDGEKKLHDLTGKNYFVEEEKRKGELIEVDEDPSGTFLMSSRDICALELLEEMYKAGVISFKIEGRNKTIYYASIVTRAYHTAIKALKQGNPSEATKYPGWRLANAYFLIS